jgi:hypothetical protein
MTSISLAPSVMFADMGAPNPPQEPQMESVPDLEEVYVPADPVRPEELTAFARTLLQGRRKRERVMRDVDFGEPAWDMLLDLFASERERNPITISGLCLTAGVPTRTAMRRISAMIADAHLICERDQRDRRRVNVRLSAELSAKMETVLTEMYRGVKGGL